MIYNYGYKPDPEFRYAGRENTATTRTYGLELEVSTRRGVSHIDRQARRHHRGLYVLQVRRFC